MTPRCVLDASVVARWWLAAARDELTAPAVAFLEARRDEKIEIHVPDLLLAEVGNAFWKSVRFHDWPPSAAKRAARDLMDAGLLVHATTEIALEAIDFAIEYRRSVYDSAYVALAHRLGVPLYTADESLVRALSGTPVQVLSIKSRAGERPGGSHD